MLAVADIDTGVGAGLALIAAGIVEKHQIAGLKLGNAVDFRTHAAEPLTGSGVRQGIARLLEYVHGEAGAIKPRGRRATVHIRSADVALGDSDGTLAGGGLSCLCRCDDERSGLPCRLRALGCAGNNLLEPLRCRRVVEGLGQRGVHGDARTRQCQSQPGSCEGAPNGARH